MSPPPQLVPGHDDLRVAPELAVLSVLDATLCVARAALLVENPEIGHLAEVFAGDPPPLCSALASLVLARVDELHDLLGWYRVAIANLHRQRLYDDDVPF